MTDKNTTSTENYAFIGILNPLSCQNSVKIIGNYAFCGCHALKSIAIPDSVKIIGDHTFRHRA